MGTWRTNFRIVAPELIRNILVGILFFWNGSIIAAPAPETITIGYNHVPPDTMNLDGVAGGPANQFLERVVKRMGYKASFKYLPLARLIRQANENQIDMINRIGANPTLKIKPTVPFTATTPGILVTKKSGVKSWPELVASKSFRIGTKIGMPLTEHMKAVNDKIVYQPGTRALENCVLMAHRGRLEGIYSPALGELVVMASELNILNDFFAVKLPDKPWNVYVAFSPSAHKQLYEKYLTALAEEQKSQPYHTQYRKFLQKFFPQMPSEVLASLSRSAPTLDP